ncbi:lipopolysaccharide biosynthesis protein [Actinopolymorpha pittospori]
MTGSVDLVAGRIARNSAVLLASRLVSLVAGAATVPLLYSRLGEHQFGVWVLLGGLISLLAYADLGLGPAQIREVARGIEEGRPRQTQAVLALGCVWGIGFAAVAFVGCMTCWPLVAFVFGLGTLTEPAGRAILILLVGFCLGNAATPWRSVLEGAQLYGQVGIVDSSTAFLTAVVTILVVVLGGGLVALAAGVALVGMCRAALLIWVARHHLPMLGPRLRCVRRTDISSVLRYGLPIQVTSLAMAVNAEADRLVLGGFGGPAVAAAFEPGSRLAGLLRIPVSMATIAAFPAAAAAAGDSRRIDRLYQGMTRYMTAFGAVGGAFLIVTADPLIRLWLGSPVPLAAATVAVMSAGYVVNVTASAASVVTRAEGRPGCETRYALVAATLNVILTVPFLKVLGPWGVPFSSAVSASIASCYFLASFLRGSGRPLAPLTRLLLPPGLAAVVAVVVPLLVADVLPDGAGRGGAALAVLSRGGLAVLLSLGVLTLLRYFDATDRERLRRILASLTRGKTVAVVGERR